jgi:hypothetical protein
MAPYKMGANFKAQDWFAEVSKSLFRDPVVVGATENTVINGNEATLLHYGVAGRFRAIFAAVKYGQNIYYYGAYCVEDQWSSYEPILRESIMSFVPKRAD